MFENLLTIVHIQNNERPYFLYVLEEIEKFCDDIILVDPYNLIHTRSYPCYHEPVGELIDEIDSFLPSWVLSLTDSTIPEYRFRVFKDSLLLNEFVNTWQFSPQYLWNDLKTERVDGFWGIKSGIPSLFRWIPEIDYQWKTGEIIPSNQSGPFERSGLKMQELGYVTPQQRQEKYLSYLSMKGILNYSTQQWYESLLDINPKLRRIEK